MLEISATKLRSHLFEYLTKVSNGESIVISRNNKKIAKIIGVDNKVNWRDRVNVDIQVNVSDDDLIKPLDDIWTDYI